MRGILIAMTLLQSCLAIASVQGSDPTSQSGLLDRYIQCRIDAGESSDLLQLVMLRSQHRPFDLHGGVSLFRTSDPISRVAIPIETPTSSAYPQDSSTLNFGSPDDAYSL